MRVLHESSDELFAQAALFSLGLLDAEESSDFELHAADCPLCSGELRTAEELIVSLALTCELQTPPASLKDRILRSISEPGPQVWKKWTPTEAAPVDVVRQEEGDWQTIRSGIHVKKLHADPSRDTITMLIRMEPGAAYIPHRHAGPEQCLVLEGDLHHHDLILHAGDFQCANEGTSHGAQWTENGCLLLIVCSQNDELLV